MSEQRRTRRAWLVLDVSAAAAANGEPMPLFTILEAVSSTAIEHPEWDMYELFTREEWEAIQ